MVRGMSTVDFSLHQDIVNGTNWGWQVLFIKHFARAIDEVARRICGAGVARDSDNLDPGGIVRGVGGAVDITRERPRRAT